MERNYETNRNKKFEFIKLDILNEGIFSLLRNEKIKYIIHLAAKDIYYDFSENKGNKNENNFSMDSHLKSEPFFTRDSSSC